MRLEARRDRAGAFARLTQILDDLGEAARLVHEDVDGLPLLRILGRQGLELLCLHRDLAETRIDLLHDVREGLGEIDIRLDGSLQQLFRDEACVWRGLQCPGLRGIGRLGEDDLRRFGRSLLSGGIFLAIVQHDRDRLC